MLQDTAMSALMGMATSSDESKPALTLLAAYLVVILFALLLPAYYWASYTIRFVYNTLAIVEDPTLASYKAVPSEKNNDATPATDADAAAVTSSVDVKTDGKATNPPKPKPTKPSKPTEPITSSLRSVHRTLRADGRGSFHGLRLIVLMLVLSRIVTAIVGALVSAAPDWVVDLMKDLVLVQFATALVHMAIRTSSPRRPSIFRGGQLPPFRRTFMATAAPTVLRRLSSEAISGIVERVLSKALLVLGRLPNDSDGISAVLTDDSMGLIRKLLLVGLVGFVALVSVVLPAALDLPAEMLLVRVQVSLLPPDEDTVVPFDRSFGGTVKPVAAGGRGYATMRDAARTISVASYRRVARLYVKASMLVMSFCMLAAGLVVVAFHCGREQTEA